MDILSDVSTPRLFECRTCVSCNSQLPLSAFPKANNQPDGIGYICRECGKKLTKHQKGALYCRAGRIKRGYKTERVYHLKTNKGVTQEEYDRMFEAQNGVCAICKQPEKTVRKRVRLGQFFNLAVDHDHATGKIRALLCRGCNVKLGNVEKTPSFYSAALDYLKTHSD